MKVAVACGGTGGHVLPGLTTARELMRRGATVTLWLAGRDVEAGSISGWEGPVVSIPVPAMTNSRWGWLGKAIGLACTIRSSLAVMRRQPLDVLLAMGSYASVGPVAAARRLRVPVVLHEANVVPGRAVTWLARWADAVAVSFPQTRRWLKHRRIVETGFPLRGDLDDRFSGAEFHKQAFTVLVMGGSQGAHALNLLAVEAFRAWKQQGARFQVLHLAGRHDASRVEDAYRSAGIDARVYGFLGAIGKAYHAADCAIARSGAGACFELLACRVPGLLVPLPSAARDHQTANAQAMQEWVGMDWIRQADLTAQRLLETLNRYRALSGPLDNMRHRMENTALVNGVGSLAELVESMAGSRLAGAAPEG